MASTPFTIVGQIAYSTEYDRANVRVYLRNVYGDELEVQYDPYYDYEGFFTVNAGNFNHPPVYQEYLTICAIDVTGDDDSGYRINYNFKVLTSPQFLQPITLEPYDNVGPVINGLYFLEGAYTHLYDNHLMIDVDDASSMMFTGDVASPLVRVLFNDRIVIKLTSGDGAKTVNCRFYDEHNNYSDREIGIILDTVKPHVVSVNGIDHQSVEIVFDEVINSTDANNKLNYRITGMTVSSATLQVDNRTIVITTDDRMFGIRYNMEIANVRDLAGNIIDTLVISFEGIPYAGFIWTDEIVADDGYIKAIHLQELRDNAIERGVIPPTGGWTDPSIMAETSDIYFEHWNELRARISLLYAQRYGKTLSWVSGPIIVGVSNLSARHVKELRAVVDAL